MPAFVYRLVVLVLHSETWRRVLVPSRSSFSVLVVIVESFRLLQCLNLICSLHDRVMRLIFDLFVGFDGASFNGGVCMCVHRGHGYWPLGTFFCEVR